MREDDWLARGTRVNDRTRHGQRTNDRPLPFAVDLSPDFLYRRFGTCIATFDMTYDVAYVSQTSPGRTGQCRIRGGGQGGKNEYEAAEVHI